VAGLIAALFGGRSAPPPVDYSTPGGGGYTAGPGPTGEHGFPGSTSLTRTMPGRNPRVAKIQSDTNVGFEQALSDHMQVRQAARSFGTRNGVNPRTTSKVSTPQPLLTALLQAGANTHLGGLLDKTKPGARTVGGNPLSEAQAEGGHSVLDTETPFTKRQPDISGGVPGSNNVRNTIAQRYKNPPGQMHTYLSAPRPDMAPVNPTGQASDGNVHPAAAVTPVTVPNRFVWNNGGVQTYSALSEMPYAGRGNGARGADLNGQRYYATGQQDQFWNAGSGDYGIHRQAGQGVHRPVAFTQPAPWTGNFYDTTPEAQAGTSPQVPDAVYVSPQTAGRIVGSVRRG
jgi:hypothetical protein